MENPVEAAPGPPTCAACAAKLPDGARFCDACGATVGKAPRGAGARGDSLVRALAAGELARGAADIRFVRTAFWAAFAVGIVTAALVLPLAFASPEPGMLAVTISLLLLHLGLCLAGALLCQRQPALWTITGACFFTLTALLILLRGGIPVLAILTAVAFWGLVPKSIRLRRLLEEFPDLRTARRLRGELPRAPEGEATSRASARARRLDSEGRRSLFVIGGIGVGIAALMVLWGALNRPPPVDDSVAAFSEAWASGDLNAMGAHFRAGSQEGPQAGIEKILRKRGWLRAPPPIVRTEVESADRKSAKCRLFLKEGGNLVTTWRFDDRRWVLTGIEFPSR